MPSAIAYLRCSTDEQVDSRAGLDAQLHAIRSWADKHGIELVATFSDEGVSGAAPLDKRPGRGPTTTSRPASCSAASSMRSLSTSGFSSPPAPAPPSRPRPAKASGSDRCPWGIWPTAPPATSGPTTMRRRGSSQWRRSWLSWPASVPTVPLAARCETSPPVSRPTRSPPRPAAPPGATARCNASLTERPDRP